MIVISKIWLTDDAVFVQAVDGRIASERFEDYPRLRNTTREQLAHYEADNLGIHWPALNEDLCYEGFFTTKKAPTQLFVFFQQHPELNVSAIARRMRMKQSLMAAYISGAKIPSPRRLNEITEEIRKIGQEICEISF